MGDAIRIVPLNQQRVPHYALHTWGQTLEQHLHLRCLVLGGALARDGSRWLSAKPGFLFPVLALARVFRGKYLAGLQRAFARQALRFAGSVAGLAHPAAFAAFVATCRATDWVVYAKPPFGGPAQVLGCLGRYTHRMAISNERLVSVDAGQLRFRWKDYAHGHRIKTMTLSADEFLRRFLLHVLPDRFVRIRHFGLCANRTRTRSPRGVAPCSRCPSRRPRFRSSRWQPSCGG